MRISSQHDHAHPALDIVRHVRKRLALAKRRLRLVDEDSVAAKRIDGGFERKPRAQRCLLEKQHHLAPAAVERRGRPEGHLLDREVADGAEIAATQALSRLRERAIGLNAERTWLGGTRRIGSGLRLRTHHDSFATHANVLLPAPGRLMLHSSK